jgi:hypothetical protein
MSIPVALRPSNKSKCARACLARWTDYTDGQFVKEGDLLFVIDPRPFEIAVDSAKADVTKAQAQVVLAATDAKTSRGSLDSVRSLVCSEAKPPRGGRESRQ